MSKNTKLTRGKALGCALTLCASSVGALVNVGYALADSDEYVYYSICDTGKAPVTIYRRKLENDYKVRGAYKVTNKYDGVLDEYNHGDRYNAGIKALEDRLSAGNDLTNWVKSGTTTKYTFGQAFTSAEKKNNLYLCAVFTDLKHDVYYGSNKLTEGEPYEIKDEDDRLMGAISFARTINTKTNRKDVNDIDITYTLTPSNYYSATKYAIDGGTAKNVSDNTIKVEDVTKDVSLSMQFERLQFELEVETGDYSTVEFPENDDVVGSTAMVLSGNSQTVKIAPIDNYKITGVQITKEGSEPITAEITNPELFEITLEDITEDYTFAVFTDPKIYTITAEADEYGEVEVVTNSVDLDGTAKFTYTPQPGYELGGIFSDTTAVIYGVDIATGEIIVQNIDDDYESEFQVAKFTFVSAPVHYHVVEGADQVKDLSADIEEKHEVTVRIDGELDLLTGVEFDGRLLDEEEYEATSGSTVLHFSYDFMMAAGNGEHLINALYNNGTSVATTLTIAGAPEAPKTGLFSAEKGGATASVILSAAIATIFGFIALAFKKLRKKQA